MTEGFDLTPIKQFKISLLREKNQSFEESERKICGKVTKYGSSKCFKWYAQMSIVDRLKSSGDID